MANIVINRNSKYSPDQKPDCGIGKCRDPLPGRISALIARFALALALATAVTPAVAQPAPRPNIVYIVADDLGWKDVGFNGCGHQDAEHRQARPRRRQARAVLCAAHVHADPRGPDDRPLSVPLRPADRRHSLGRTYGLPTDEWLLPQALKEAGYRPRSSASGISAMPTSKYWPRQRGFDYQYGAMIGEMDYFTHEEHRMSSTGIATTSRSTRRAIRTTLSATTPSGSSRSTTRPCRSFSISPSTPRTRLIRRRRNTWTSTRTSRIRRRRTYAGMVTAWTTRSAAWSPRSTRRDARQHAHRLPQRQRRHPERDVLRRHGRHVEGQDSVRQRPVSRRQGHRSSRAALRVCALANWPGHIKPRRPWTE